jgi:hypothetical protein
MTPTVMDRPASRRRWHGGTPSGESPSTRNPLAPVAGLAVFFCTKRRKKENHGGTEDTKKERSYSLKPFLHVLCVLCGKPPQTPNLKENVMVLKFVPPAVPMPATIEDAERKVGTELHVVSRRPWPDWALRIVYRAFYFVFIRLLRCTLEIRVPALKAAPKQPPTAAEAHDAFNPYYARSAN